MNRCSRSLLYAIVILIFAGTLLLGSTPQSLHAADAPVRAAFVYTGKAGAPGWDSRHEQGRKYLEKTLGDKVETTMVEQVSAGDAERVFEQLIRKDYDILFGTTYAFMDPMVNVAKNHPDILFEHCSGYKRRDNLGTYYARMYQAKYLAGVVAGLRTETDQIGYVAPHPIPQIIRLVNAYARGARSVNPDVTTRVLWTNSWYDQAKAKDATNSLIEQGADVINHQITGAAPLQAAQEHDVYAFGMHAELPGFAESAVLGNQIWQWGPFYVDTVKQVLNGTWESNDYFGGLKQGVVDLKLTDQVTPQERQAVQNARQKITNGELSVFEGPVYDKDGTLKVHEGETLSDKELNSMKWLVKGVKGNVP